MTAAAIIRCEFCDLFVTEMFVDMRGMVELNLRPPLVRIAREIRMAGCQTVKLRLVTAVAAIVGHGRQISFCPLMFAVTAHAGK